MLFENDFYAESNDASFKVRKPTVFKQRSFEVVEYAKFQLLVIPTSLFTGSSSLSVFPRGVLYVQTYY